MVGYDEPPPYRDGGMPQIALPRVTPAVKVLLIANAGVFLVFWFLGWVLGLESVRWLYDSVLALRPTLWVDWFPLVPVWQIGTYGFLHGMGSLGHLLGNLLGLYFFGTMLEEMIGTRRFAFLYGAAIVLGAVVTLLWSALASPVAVIGASGGVLAVVVATAVLRPNQMVIVLFIPLTLKWVAAIFVGMDAFMFLSGSPDGVAHQVHLAGAAYGFLAARQGWLWRDPLAGLERRREEAAERREVADAERLDQLLKRIHDEGMNSLSRRDREFLRRVSSRR